MPTYFNYVEREADSYVNWADVGRDMSNTIDDIQRVREEKKALIEKTYREDLKFIQDNPTGEHENLRTWALNMGQSSAEMMRLQNTLLKQGKLNLNNYLSFRQNLTDSVEKIYTVNSQLQEAFKEVNDRTKKSANQQLERETKVLLEKYGKLEDTEAYINPLNGTIYLGLTEIAEEDGKSVRKLKKGEGTYLSPDQLQAAAMQKFDKFDERPVLKEFVDGLGDVNEQIRQIGGEALAGKILSITDVTYERIMQIAESLPEGQKLTPNQMEQLKKYAKDFNEAETKYIDGILKNPFDASSLLTENIKGKDGKIYNIVFNKADQKTEYDIYVDKTDSKFTPVFDESTEIGKKQKEVLTNYLRGQLRVMYDRKVEQASVSEPQKQQAYNRAPTEAEIRAGERRKDAATFGSIVGRVYGQDYVSRESALSSLRDYLPEDGYVFFGKDNAGDYVLASKGGTDRKKIYLTKNGKPVPIDDFTADFSSYVIGTSAIGKDLDVARARARQESRGGTFSTDFGDASNRNFVFWNDKFKIEQEYNTLKKEYDDTWKRNFMTQRDIDRMNELKQYVDKFYSLDEGGQQGQTTTNQGKIR